MREGADVLAFQVGGMGEDGIRVSRPRTLEATREAKQDWVEMEDAIVATVPLLPPQGWATGSSHDG